ncbi:hypothetical protein SLS54_007609 [Diplodia seriata]
MQANLMREATKLMESADPDGNTQKLTAFFSHMLSITVSGPEASPLTLVDLPGQGMRQVTSQQGLEWARNHKCGFMETSAEDLVWNASPYMITSEDYLTNNKYL